MPLPRPNETWRHNTTGLERIVGSVHGNVVHLVGLQAERSKHPLSEIAEEWALLQPGPATFRGCARHGCHRPAFLLYRRNQPEQRDEVVCPHHLPLGVQARRVSNEYLPHAGFYGDYCPACSGDGVEVFTEQPQTNTVSVWCCAHSCELRWMRIHSILDIADHAKLASLAPYGYRLDNKEHATGDGWVVWLAPKPQMEPESRTLFEYLNREADPSIKHHI